MNKIGSARLPLLLAVLLLFFESVCHGQGIASIKLRNSAQLKNVAIYDLDSTGIFIRLGNDSVLQKLSFSNIRRVRFASQRMGWKNGLEVPEVKGFDRLYHFAALGILAGSEGGDFSFVIVNGYKITDCLYGGIGLGYDRYQPLSALPVFTEGRFYLKAGKFVPYGFGHLGYGFVVENKSDSTQFQNYEASGGIMWAIGMGYQLNFPSNALVLTVGYSSQKSLQKYDFGDYLKIEEQRTFRKIDVKLGLLF